MTKLELLAPARNAETAIEAVKHGADAVYIGALSHGARANATNSLDDISRVVAFAHPYRARVYATINTLVYDDELASVRDLVCRLFDVGVDALIVQDMSLLEMDIPPIALHASTQCDIRTSQKARFLADAGFSQLVLPRELSLREIEAIRDAVDVPLETFVHGALCVSYSGDCRASLMATGRSANRGECAQMCRLPYDLIDGRGKRVLQGKHLLSLRDMNRSMYIAEMAAAGISSFKIEGRLKDVAYVKETVAYYSKLMDALVESDPGRYARASAGRSCVSFVPDPANAFNRGFTDYFLTSVQPDAGSMVNMDSPKSVGRPVATVGVASRGNRITVRADYPLHNGDGLSYFDRDGLLRGFRVNRVEGSTVYAASAVDLSKGTLLYRSRDAEHDRLLAGDTAERKIDIEVTLRSVGTEVLVADATDERGCRVSVTHACALQTARTPQADRHRAELSKTGDTIYNVSVVNDSIPDVFVPASVLSALRRKLVETLDRCARATYSYDYRRADIAGRCFKPTLEADDNVANRLAQKFYERHGAHTASWALEVSDRGGLAAPVRVMATRYCLRRELGACLKTPGAKNMPGPLAIEGHNIRFDLDFDCKSCRMNVIYIPDCSRRNKTGAATRQGRI